MRDEDAKSILQNCLDAKARMILEGEAERYANELAYPFVLVTEDTEAHFDGPEQFMDYFQMVAGALRGAAVTDYVRIVRAARFISPDVICGEWQTHIMRRCHRLAEPFSARARLIRVNGAWKFSRCVYAMTWRSMPLRLPEASKAEILRDKLLEAPASPASVA